MRSSWFLLVPVAFGALACGSRSYCPGMCPAANRFPVLTIETDDRQPSIASAKILNGPCVHLLVGSTGEAGVRPGYQAAQITYSGPTDIPPLCLIELTSLFGDSQYITAQVRSRQSKLACCSYSSCCTEAQAMTTRADLEFDPPLQTVAFPPRLDAGDAIDAGASLDVESNALETPPGEVGGPMESAYDANEDSEVDLANNI